MGYLALLLQVVRGGIPNLNLAVETGCRQVPSAVGTPGHRALEVVAVALRNAGHFAAGLAEVENLDNARLEPCGDVVAVERVELDGPDLGLRVPIVEDAASLQLVLSLPDVNNPDFVFQEPEGDEVVVVGTVVDGGDVGGLAAVGAHLQVDDLVHPLDIEDQKVGVARTHCECVLLPLAPADFVHAQSGVLLALVVEHPLAAESPAARPVQSELNHLEVLPAPHRQQPEARTRVHRGNAPELVLKAH
jgi:hypothetical protein